MINEPQQRPFWDRESSPFAAYLILAGHITDNMASAVKALIPSAALLKRRKSSALSGPTGEKDDSPEAGAVSLDATQGDIPLPTATAASASSGISNGITSSVSGIQNFTGGGVGVAGFGSNSISTGNSNSNSVDNMTAAQMSLMSLRNILETSQQEKQQREQQRLMEQDLMKQQQKANLSQSLNALKGLLSVGQSTSSSDQSVPTNSPQNNMQKLLLRAAAQKREQNSQQSLTAPQFAAAETDSTTGGGVMSLLLRAAAEQKKKLQQQSEPAPIPSTTYSSVLKQTPKAAQKAAPKAAPKAVPPSSLVEQQKASSKPKKANSTTPVVIHNKPPVPPQNVQVARFAGSSFLSSPDPSFVPMPEFGFDSSHAFFEE